MVKPAVWQRGWLPATYRSSCSHYPPSRLMRRFVRSWELTMKLWTRQVDVIAKALAMTVIDQISIAGNIFVGPAVKKFMGQPVPPKVKVYDPNRKQPDWASSKLLTKKAIDGAVLAGKIPANAFAKYAIRNGLPEEGQRTLAIENPPHTVDDFNGRIEQGYGKGVKNLLLSSRIPVKVEGNTPFLGKVNYHIHHADRAGTHYDLVVEGVPPGTKQFEINIPNGPYKGRYAFVDTERGKLVLRMKDRGVNLPKPSYKLKQDKFLNEVTQANRAAPKGSEPYIVEWKPDGSLGNASIEEYRTVFRSHRESADTYYDKLPGLEFTHSQPMSIGQWLTRPKTESYVGTVLQGELFHSNGVGFVSGVLNSLPERAQAAQEKEGPVQFYAWDIQTYKGKDVSQLPYRERRALVEQVVGYVSQSNPNYHVVKRMDPRGDAKRFYDRITSDSRGLPWSEGVVVKTAGDEKGVDWPKVKSHDFSDVVITGFVEGNGDLAGSLGKILVESYDGTKSGAVGTGFSDLQGQWIWDNQDKLYGATVKVKVMEETPTSYRAPRFMEFHESKGKNDWGLQMYAFELAMGVPSEAKRILYSLKSAVGWRPK